MFLNIQLLALTPTVAVHPAPVQRKIQAALRARYRTVGPPRSAAPKALSKVLERVGAETAASAGAALPALCFCAVLFAFCYLEQLAASGMRCRHHDMTGCTAGFVEKVWSATLPGSEAVEDSAAAMASGRDTAHAATIKAGLTGERASSACSEMPSWVRVC